MNRVIENSQKNMYLNSIFYLDIYMKYFIWGALMLMIYSCKPKIVDIHIVETTDLHGCFFNYDFATRESRDGSLAQVAYYVDSLRQSTGEIVLLDNGDIMQGDPVVYFSNYIQPSDDNITSRVLNFMNYDAVTIGNHDVETGFDVFDSVFRNSQTPWLGANVVKSETNKPAYEDYVIVEKKGVKIAILGLTTPGIPNWLPDKLYEGLEFRDMIEAAQETMELVKSERPDLVIGLFHAGLDANYGGNTHVDYLNPNATLVVAEQVSGFDVVFAGHDHKSTVKNVVNIVGDTVLVVNGGSHGKGLGHVIITYDLDAKRMIKKVGAVVDVTKVPANSEFIKQFAPYLDSVKHFFYQTVGVLETELCPQQSLVGPTDFMQFIHEIQLKATDADVSLSAPLQIRNCIDAGEITWSDVFSIYRFENYLACINMTIGEIDKFLEYSIKDWFNTMNSADDALLLLSTDNKLQHPYFNFSSALGIEYIVDVSQPDGAKVEILAVAGRHKFSFQDTLRVALNSYRMVGGGGHLPLGAGISREMLAERDVWISEQPIKSIIIDFFKEQHSVRVKKCLNWTVIPEAWVKNKARKALVDLGLIVE